MENEREGRLGVPLPHYSQRPARTPNTDPSEELQANGFSEWYPFSHHRVEPVGQFWSQRNPRKREGKRMVRTFWVPQDRKSVV